MKIPKNSCSACGKPSSRKWNLYRHISNCHAGIRKCLPNWNFPDTYRPYWNRWQKGGETDHIGIEGKNDRKPDYVFMEAYLKELAKRAVSSIQPTQCQIVSLSFQTGYHGRRYMPLIQLPS
jgi:hypothetical protein